MYTLVIIIFNLNFWTNINDNHVKIININKEFNLYCKNNYNFEYNSFHEFIKFNLKDINHFKFVLYFSIFLALMSLLNFKLFTVFSYLNHFKMVYVIHGLYKWEYNHLILNEEFINLILLLGITFMIVGHKKI